MDKKKKKVNILLLIFIGKKNTVFVEIIFKDNYEVNKGDKSCLHYGRRGH